MAFGSVNTPGAWLVAVKNQLKEMLARIGSVEKTLTGLEKIPGTSTPTAQVTAKVGQIYINTATGEEWKCIAVNDTGSVWEKQTKTGTALTAADVGAVPTTRKVNNKALSADITLTAADVGARPSTWTPTAADVGARPSTWKSYHAGTSAPSDTTQLWIDTTANTGGLKYYNGSAWVHVPVAYT